MAGEKTNPTASVEVFQMRLLVKELLAENARLQEEIDKLNSFTNLLDGAYVVDNHGFGHVGDRG